jgi:hypothetical protein
VAPAAVQAGEADSAPQPHHAAAVGHPRGTAGAHAQRARALLPVAFPLGVCFGAPALALNPTHTRACSVDTQTGRSDSVAVVRQREEALNRRLAALPGIAVSGVGGVIDLTPLQQRCHLDALQHEFVSEEEVRSLLP